MHMKEFKSHAFVLSLPRKNGIVKLVAAFDLEKAFSSNGQVASPTENFYVIGDLSKYFSVRGSDEYRTNWVNIKTPVEQYVLQQPPAYSWLNVPKDGLMAVILTEFPVGHESEIDVMEMINLLRFKQLNVAACPKFFTFLEENQVDNLIIRGNGKAPKYECNPMKRLMKNFGGSKKEKIQNFVNVAVIKDEDLLNQDFVTIQKCAIQEVPFKYDNYKIGRLTPCKVNDCNLKKIAPINSVPTSYKRSWSFDSDLRTDEGASCSIPMPSKKETFCENHGVVDSCEDEEDQNEDMSSIIPLQDDATDIDFLNDVSNQINQMNQMNQPETDNCVIRGDTNRADQVAEDKKEQLKIVYANTPITITGYNKEANGKITIHIPSMETPKKYDFEVVMKKNLKVFVEKLRRSGQLDKLFTLKVLESHALWFEGFINDQNEVRFRCFLCYRQAKKYLYTDIGQFASEEGVKAVNERYRNNDKIKGHHQNAKHLHILDDYYQMRRSYTKDQIDRNQRLPGEIQYEITIRNLRVVFYECLKYIPLTQHESLTNLIVSSGANMGTWCRSKAKAEMMLDALFKTTLIELKVALTNPKSPITLILDTATDTSLNHYVVVLFTSMEFGNVVVTRFYKVIVFLKK